MILNDEQFFAAYPDRQARIRMPYPHDEAHKEFHELGDHPAHRRRILLYKVPKENPLYDPKSPQILKIPFLAFVDEVLENSDEVLLPIISTIMMEQFQTQGGSQ
jgi:hypothetical protein